MAMVMVGFFFAGVFLLRRFGVASRYSLRPLGFSRPNVGTFGGAGLGFLVGVGAVFVGGVLSALTTLVLSRFGYSTDSTVQQPFMDSLQNYVGDNPALAIPAVIAVVVVIGPACEELIFRGGIFNGLQNLGDRLSSSLSKSNPETAPDGQHRYSFGASAIIAAVLSSVFFALLHLEPVILPTLFVFALVLCYIFRKTGSLLPCFVAHATFNSFATGAIILSGLGVLPPLPA